MKLFCGTGVYIIATIENGTETFTKKRIYNFRILSYKRLISNLSNRQVCVPDR